MIDTLDTGSILPYLRKCKQFGYAVVVFNPNQNVMPLELQYPNYEGIVLQMIPS